MHIILLMSALSTPLMRTVLLSCIIIGSMHLTSGSAPIPDCLTVSDTDPEEADRHRQWIHRPGIRVHLRQPRHRGARHVPW